MSVGTFLSAQIASTDVMHIFFIDLLKTSCIAICLLILKEPSYFLHNLDLLYFIGFSSKHNKTHGSRDEIKNNSFKIV